MQLSPECFPWPGCVDGGVEGTGDGGVGCVVGAVAGGVSGDTGVEGNEAGVGVGGYVGEGTESSGSIVIPSG